MVGKKILVVDDDPTLRYGFGAILEYAGAVAYSAENGAAAVRWLEGDPVGCDIILMDLQMPVMDGMAAAKHIREVLEMAALPIIAVTGQSLHKIEKEAKRVGFTHVLEKPVMPDELLKVIGKFLHLNS